MKKSIEESNSSLSPFEKSVQLFIDNAKTAFEEARENLKMAKYLESYKWLNEYINSEQIFHLNEFYDYLKDHPDLQHKKIPALKTISRVLHKLFKVGLLEYRSLPSNYRYPYSIYWIPFINEEFKEHTLKSYITKYKEPKHKKSRRITQEEEIPDSVQSKLDHYRRKIIEEKTLAPVKKELQEEKNKQSAWNQKDYLEKQKEVVKEHHEETTTGEIFQKSLKKHVQKKADTITKNVFDEQQRELTPEQRKGQALAIIEEMEDLKIVVPESIKKRPEQLEKVASSKKKKKVIPQITEESFSDTSNYQVVDERVEEGG